MSKRRENRRVYNEYLKSPQWVNVKMAFYKKHPKACAVCGSKRELHLHHTTYEHIFHELDHLDDLVCLCKKHHTEQHDRKPAPPARQKRKARKARKARPASRPELTPAEQRREDVIARLKDSARFEWLVDVLACK